MSSFVRLAYGNGLSDKADKHRYFRVSFGIPFASSLTVSIGSFWYRRRNLTLMPIKSDIFRSYGLGPIILSVLSSVRLNSDTEVFTDLNKLPDRTARN